MKLYLFTFFFLNVLDVSAQPLKPDTSLDYLEQIGLTCQANLSSLYQERRDMVDEMEKGRVQAIQSLSKLGLKNPNVNLEKIPPVLSEKLDLEHANALEKKNEDEFLDWESRFFMSNAREYMKDCVLKTIEIHKECSKNKKTAKTCMDKKMPLLNEVAQKHIPFLKYLEENSKDEKKSKSVLKKNKQHK